MPHGDDCSEYLLLELLRKQSASHFDCAEMAEVKDRARIKGAGALAESSDCFEYGDEELELWDGDEKTSEHWSTASAEVTTGVLLSARRCKAQQAGALQRKLADTLRIATANWDAIPPDVAVEVDVRFNGVWIKETNAPLYVAIDVLPQPRKTTKEDVFSHWEISVVRRASWRRFLSSLMRMAQTVAKGLWVLVKLVAKLVVTPPRWLALAVIQVGVWVCRSARWLWRRIRGILSRLWRRVVPDSAEAELEDVGTLDNVQEWITRQVEEVEMDVEYILEAESFGSFCGALLAVSTTFGS